MGKAIRVTLSKNELVKGDDGKWYYKELKREVLHDRPKRPAYWARFLELRAEGKTHWECSVALNSEGYTLKNKKLITENTLRASCYYYGEGL